MSEFSSKRIKGESFGEMLQNRRQRMGYTLMQVARALQINKTYLEFLEREEFDSLPPPVYVFGFLKRYARFLKLDQNVVLRRFKTEASIAGNLHPQDKEKQYITKSILRRISPLAVNPRALKIAVIVLAVIGFFIYLGWEFFGFSAPPDLKVVAPQNNERINTDSVFVVGQVDIGSEIFINGQPIFIDPQGAFREEIILSEGLNIIEVVARNKLGKTRREERNILVNLPEDATEGHREEGSSEEGAGEESEELVLTVEIRESATWVSIDTDGTNTFQGTMLPGASQDFKAQEMISITSGKAGHTYITFQGKELGSLGEPGEVVRDVKFTRELGVGNLSEGE